MQACRDSSPLGREDERAEVSWCVMRVSVQEMDERYSYLTVLVSLRCSVVLLATSKREEQVKENGKINSKRLARPKEQNRLNLVVYPSERTRESCDVLPLVCVYIFND